MAAQANLEKLAEMLKLLKAVVEIEMRLTGGVARSADVVIARHSTAVAIERLTNQYQTEYVDAHGTLPPE